jgi:hypothetical protein
MQHAWEMRNAYKKLVGIPEGKIIVRPRRRWDDNIKSCSEI